MFCITCCLGNASRYCNDLDSKSDSFIHTIFSDQDEVSHIKQIENITTDADVTDKSTTKATKSHKPEAKCEYLPLYIEEAGILKDSGKKIQVIT